MTSAYRLTRSARRDLREISDFWTAEAGEEVALRVVGGVIETIITMARYPRAGVVADQFDANPYSRGIELLHVFHGSRDQAKAWRKPGRHASTR